MKVVPIQLQLDLRLFLTPQLESKYWLQLQLLKVTPKKVLRDSVQSCYTTPKKAAIDAIISIFRITCLWVIAKYPITKNGPINCKMVAIEALAF